MSKTIKHDFMIRLRAMVNHVVRTKANVNSYCPASTLPLVPFKYPVNEILSNKYCLTCKEVMGIAHSRVCPCSYYELKTVEEAQKRIREYFGKEKERGEITCPA